MGLVRKNETMTRSRFMKELIRPVLFYEVLAVIGAVALTGVDAMFYRASDRALELFFFWLVVMQLTVVTRTILKWRQIRRHRFR